MKLLQDNKKLHADEFSNTSPYVIMFGPDKCGATNKVDTDRQIFCHNSKLICDNRSISSSSTRTQKLENTRRSILRVPQRHQLTRRQRFTL